MSETMKEAATAKLGDEAKVELSREALRSAAAALTSKDGSAAFQEIFRSWSAFQDAFQWNAPKERLDNYFKAIQEIATHKTPHIMPIINDILSLRVGYVLDPTKNQAVQIQKVRDLIFALLARSFRYAFAEKAQPGERVETRAMAGAGGLVAVQQWERENLKSIQTPEWQAKFESILKQQADMAMGQ